jgi:uncharacterized protein (TIGR03118 family)
MPSSIRHDDVSGTGHGFIDAFDTDGNFLAHLATRGGLNSLGGVARASDAFGKFAGDLLIGNFGNGWINALVGTQFVLLNDTTGNPLHIHGLWTLTLGAAPTREPVDALFHGRPQ